MSYTVPQRLHANALPDAVEVFFRVRAVLGKSRVVVRDESGAQIAAFKRERMAPGEMENIRLPRALLEKARGALTVGVEVEE